MYVTGMGVRTSMGMKRVIAMGVMDKEMSIGMGLGDEQSGLSQ